MTSSPLSPRSPAWKELLRRALTLSERFERIEHLPPSSSPAADPNADDILRAWSKAFAPGDPAAFARRLGWDGLDEERARRALASDLDPEALPETWSRWTLRFLEESRELSSRLPESIDGLLASSGVEIDFEERPPFLELWVPALEAARKALGEIDASPAVRLRLERQLLMELGSTSELALFEHYRASFAPTESDSTSVYRDFVQDMLRHGLERFFLEFPVLARQVGVILDQWVETTRELFDRLDRDRVALAELLGVSELGRLVDIEPALSDPHLGRRRVVRLGFDSGADVVYKPRDMCIERSYNEFLRWTSEEGLDNTPPWLEVLCRPGYGFVRAARKGDVADRDSVARYFEKAGALVFLAHLLNGRDFHMENVVATEQGPVLVDPEMLLQPLAASSAEVVAGEGDEVSSLCLETGIVSLIESGPSGEVYDVGGLKGKGDVPSALRSRVWKNHKTSGLAYEEVARSERPPKNRLAWRDVDQDPSAFSRELLSGFIRAYRFFLERREQVGERFQTFTDARIRILVRPTSHYAMASRLLREPKYQRSGITSSLVLEALHRGFASQSAKPLLWPVARHEKNALQKLDVPRFDIAFSETRLAVPGADGVDGYFARSGAEGIESRLAGLGEVDLARQARALFEAVGSSVGDRFESALPMAPALGGGTSDGPFLRHALWIGEELCSGRDERTPARLFAEHDLKDDGKALPERFHLYDGVLGQGVFFAALASTTGEARWLDRVHEVSASLAEAIRNPESARAFGEDDVGACSGIASIAHGLSLIGQLTGSDSATELAFEVANVLSERRIAADRNLDVVGGSAGAILVLSALLEIRREKTILERIEWCGARLLKAASTTETGRAWPVFGRVLPGFGHGAAGIGLAFVRAFEATGNEDFLQAAAEAYLSERRLFSPARRSWSISGSGMRETVMTAWCNGAPGIALGRALGKSSLSDENVDQEIEIALQATSSAAHDGSDHVCCGNLGRADVLLTVGRLLERNDVIDSANRLAAVVVERAESRGHFRLRSSGFSYPIHSTKFFRGLPGIGYQLLRFGKPSTIPSVLAFEPMGNAAENAK